MSLDNLDFGLDAVSPVLKNMAMSGTWTAVGTVTLPAITLGGKITGGSQEIEGSNFDINGGTMAAVTLDGTLTLGGQTLDGGAGEPTFTSSGQYKGAKFTNTYDSADGLYINLYGQRATPTDGDVIARLYTVGKDDAAADTGYCGINFVAADVNVATGKDGQIDFLTMTASAAYSTKLSIGATVATWSNITHTGLDITATLAVAGTQVLQARVIDARADDAVSLGAYDATTGGVIDALRDAMITHGLIAAA